MTMENEAACGPEAEPVLTWLASRARPWFALVWMPVLLLGPVIDSAVGGRPLQAGSVVLIGTGYVFMACLPGSVGIRERWKAELVFALFMLLCTAYLFVWPADRGFLFPLLAIGAAVAVRRRWALSLISALAISGALTIGFEQWSLNAALFLGFATFFAGVGNFMVLYLSELADERARNQERLARAAVSEERLRFSRDLHDLLGHTLSVIVVTAQAVRRLVASDPDAAAGHAENIETIGREALTEIREVVGGYRSVSLGEELSGARAALAADDISVDVIVPAEGFEARLDSLLGWVVREGTTNVLRHSEAGQCRIVVGSHDGIASVEITDDGRGGRAGEGSGLRGLRERVEQVGGYLAASPTSSGFRLAASIPNPTSKERP